MRGVDLAAAPSVLKALIEVWTKAAELMVSAVAKRLARGITEDGWAEQKAREVLALRGELERIAAGLDQAAPEMVLAALEQAYGMGSKVAEQLGQLNLASRPRQVARFAAYLVGQLQGSLLPVMRAHEDVYRRAVGQVELLMQTGTMVRREAVAMAVDQLLAEGADRFVDESGRRWHLDSYVRMAGRTMAQQAMIEGQLDGMRETGRDLVVISDSVRECPLCRPWEGKLLSVTGGTPAGTRVDGHTVRGTVAEARAAGLWHPNCTHRADPYIEGLTQLAPAKAAPEAYKQQQTLRRLERDLRDLKRREAAAREIGDTQTARRLRERTRAKSAAIKQHVEATGQLRKRDRERPVSGPARPTAGNSTAPASPPPGPRPKQDPTAARPAGPSLSDLVLPADALTQDRAEEIAAAITTHLDGDYAGWDVEVDSVWLSPQSTVFSGVVRREGRQVGGWQRVVYREADGTLAVWHDYLQIDPEFQGQGFASVFNRRLYDWYRASGVRYVRTYCDIDVGGYTWARNGFEFERAAEASSVLDRLRAQVEAGGSAEELAAARDVLRRADSTEFGSDDYPTAYEISQCGRSPGAADWIGRRAMLGSDWHGVKVL